MYISLGVNLQPRICCAPSDLLARICKVDMSNAKKCGLICFPRICFRGVIYCDQEPLWLLNVIEDVCYFLGVHIFRLSTRCKMFHSKLTYPFPQKSHECAPPLTEIAHFSMLVTGDRFFFGCAAGCMFSHNLEQRQRRF